MYRECKKKKTNPQRTQETTLFLEQGWVGCLQAQKWPTRSPSFSLIDVPALPEKAALRGGCESSAAQVASSFPKGSSKQSMCHWRSLTLDCTKHSFKTFWILPPPPSSAEYRPRQPKDVILSSCSIKSIFKFTRIVHLEQNPKCMGIHKFMYSRRK